MAPSEARGGYSVRDGTMSKGNAAIKHGEEVYWVKGGKKSGKGD